MADQEKRGGVCGLYVEDLDLRLDDEHVRIHGKGGTVRTVPLDDRGYVTLLASSAVSEPDPAEAGRWFRVPGTSGDR